MRIVCPGCEAVYEIPPAVLATPGRRLRCARCAHEWRPADAPPPEQASSPEAPPLPEREHGPAPAPDATAAEEEAPRRFAAELPAGMPPLAGGRPDLSRPPGPHRPIGAVVAIAASVLLLAALAAAAYVWRAPIMQAWPPSARVYAVLHIA